MRALLKVKEPTHLWYCDHPPATSGAAPRRITVAKFMDIYTKTHSPFNYSENLWASEYGMGVSMKVPPTNDHHIAIEALRQFLSKGDVDHIVIKCLEFRIISLFQRFLVLFQPFSNKDRVSFNLLIKCCSIFFSLAKAIVSS